MLSLPPSATDPNDLDGMSLMTLQPVVEQAEQAIQSGQFEAACTLIETALTAGEEPDAQVRLLECLGQARAGLQDYAEAAQAFQRAYDAVTVQHDKARLFQCACQAYRQERDFPALLRLADLQLEHVTSGREQADCLLVAGEALVRLHRYREARECYLTPAANLDDAAPSARVYLWNYLGLCALVEHHFPEAAEAFHKSNTFGLALQYERGASAAPWQRAELHHLRNTAHFHTGAIHLIYHRPQEAVQALQAVRPPLLAERQLNTAFFLALAYLRMQQLEAADHALQPLARATELPDSVRAPYAVIRASLANRNQSLEVVGTHLEAAIEDSLQPRTSWEPSWRALMYEELGMALLRANHRKAGIACTEESLKVVVDRIFPWEDVEERNWLRGPSLFTALENLPVETWSPVVQSEMLSPLQTLAWLYQSQGNSPLADIALELALRISLTPDHRITIWLQRGWLAAVRPMANAASEERPRVCKEEVLLGVQSARSIGSHSALSDALRGIEALLREDKTQAFTCFEHLIACPEMGHAQSICLAGWIWAHAQHGDLEQTLTDTSLSHMSVWRSEVAQLETLERLLMWTLREGDTAPEGIGTWLFPLWADQAPTLVASIRLLCQRGYLADDLYSVLMASLSKLVAENIQDERLDPLAACMGYDALVSRIEPLLATVNQSPDTQTPDTREGKRRPRRRSAPQHQRRSDDIRLPNLIKHLSSISRHEGQDLLPDMILEWFLRYPRLSQNTAEVAGALLGLLRAHPGAATQRQALLEQVTLSKRQRLLLEEAQREADDALASSAPEWEHLRYATLDHLLDRLCDGKAGRATCGYTAAIEDYTLAVALSRVGLVNRATDALQACLQVEPKQPLAHFMLGQLLRLQQRFATARYHTLQAWELARTPSSPARLLHLEIVNQILVILGARKQSEAFSSWLETFDSLATELRSTSLSPDQERRLHQEEGECALSLMLYLKAVSPSAQTAEELAEQQLELLAEAANKGASLTRHSALHRRADLLSRLGRNEAAEFTYTQVLEQWPADRQARFRLALLTASRLASEPASEGVESALAEALALAFAGGPRHDRPSPLTLGTALTWLWQVPPRDSRYRDVVDVLTAYGRMAFQHDELGVAMEVLIPLYEVAGEPRQAYYLAQIYCARSQQAGSESTALDDCHRAIELAQHALQSDLHRAQASALLQQLEDEQARLSTTQLTDISQLDAQPSDVKERTEWQASPVAEIPLDRPVLQGTHKTPAPKKRSNRVRTYWSRLKHKWLHKLKW